MTGPSMKLADQILEEIFAQSEEDIKRAFSNKISNLGFEGILVDEVSVELGGDVVVSFVDDDGDQMDVLFTYDDEEGAQAIVLEDDDYEDQEADVDVIDLNPLMPKIIDLGNGNQAMDLADLSWFNTSGLIAILNAGDFIDDDEETSEMSERSTQVIRGGKKVRLAVVRRKRRKRLTPKQKAAIRKGVRKRKTKKSAIQRKRKKSLKLRKKLGIKRLKNKRMKVAGTAAKL